MARRRPSATLRPIGSRPCGAAAVDHIAALQPKRPIRPEPRRTRQRTKNTKILFEEEILRESSFFFVSFVVPGVTRRRWLPPCDARRSPLENLSHAIDFELLR